MSGTKLLCGQNNFRRRQTEFWEGRKHLHKALVEPLALHAWWATWRITMLARPKITMRILQKKKKIIRHTSFGRGPTLARAFVAIQTLATCLVNLFLLSLSLSPKIVLPGTCFAQGAPIVRNLKLGQTACGLLVGFELPSSQSG